MTNITDHKILPDGFIEYIETSFYKKIADQARIEIAIQDKQFTRNPIKHPALFTDHSVVHVRDVLDQYLHIAELANSVLIDEKSDDRMSFIIHYGAVLVYLHDIGMQNFSTRGRVMHPEFAAQYVFKPEFDELLDLLFASDNPLTGRVENLVVKDTDKQAVRMLIKEMLSLSFAHSKSKVPIEQLNDPSSLQKSAKRILFNTLEYQFALKKIDKLKTHLSQSQVNEKSNKVTGIKTKLNVAITKFGNWDIEDELQHSQNLLKAYNGKFLESSFQWLIDEDPLWNELVEDVIDSIRILRAADALRQRGTVLRTSAGYEIFIEQNSAAAIYAIRNTDASKLFLMKANDALNAGEANIASSEIDKDGNLRIAFHRGIFKSPSTIRKAAYNAAFVINDIYLDAVLSFKNETGSEGKYVNFDDICVLLERPDDNPLFHHLVIENLMELNPEAAGKCKPVVSLKFADARDINRYLAGENALLHFGGKEQLVRIVKLIEKSGHIMATSDLFKAFDEVRVVTIERDEVLIESNTRAGFVYIPMHEGLVVTPMGGYQKVHTKAWVPIGNTGVIRGATRNARIVSENELTLLMIPSQTYLSHWHKPYRKRALMKILHDKLKDIDQNSSA